MALLLASLPLPGTEAEARVRWQTPGAYRFRLVSIDAFPLDSTGVDSGQLLFGEHRLRIDPTIEVGPVKVHIQVDVLTGQSFGDTQSVGARFVERRHGDPERSFDGWTTVDPRQAWLELDLEWLRLEVGQLGAHWGIGLLENSGDDPRGPEDPEAPQQGEIWVEKLTDRRNGDLYDRVRLATTPLAAFTHGAWADLVVAIGGDHVWQDDEASSLDGDVALQAFASVFYPGEEVFAGAHVVYRFQTDRDGDELSVTAFDLHGRWQVPLYLLRAQFRVEAEGLLRLGSTDRHRPGGRAAGVDLRQLGWVARSEISWRCPRLALGLEAGYASGDADPDDGDKRDLTFDPDHRVGLVLFTDVLRLVTLRGAERLADPTRVGVAEAGAEQLPTDGAVRNALYVEPVVTWRPGAWRLTTAVLVAWGAEPFLDPFETFAAGGSGRGHLGEDASTFYGVELAGGAHYGVRVKRVGDAELGVQAGVLFPGGALGQALGNHPVTKVLGRLDLRW